MCLWLRVISIRVRRLPPRRFARRGGAIARPRQSFEWAGVADSSPRTLSGPGKQLVSSFQVANPVTLVRAYLSLASFSDQTAAEELSMSAVGMIIISEDAFAVGITAIPGPITDMGSPWWLHGFFPTGLQPLTSSGEIQPSGVLFESRSMRKIGTNERVAVVVEVSTSFGINFLHGARILARLT